MADNPDLGPSANRFRSNPQTPQQQQSRPTSHPGLDRPASNAPLTSRPGVVQPKPQALAKRSGPTSIIVSPRQKGNPILSHIKGVPWEYGDIPADYQLGATACALFLSLKYHRLHPEYIYNRIKSIQGKYQLRVILTLVDIDNHEASIRELTKTSVINQVTIILCWSAAEGGRYLELFKSYEHASPTAIRQHQSTAYTDRMVDFVTTPRAVNKTDAIALVTQFGTVRTAVNARPDDLAALAGWGEKKVQQWCASVREPFRVEGAAKRTIDLERLNLVATQSISRATTLSRGPTLAEGEDEIENDPEAGLTRRAEPEAAIEPVSAAKDSVSDTTAPTLPATATVSAPTEEAPKKRKPAEDAVSDGVMAALSKLRKAG